MGSTPQQCIVLLWSQWCEQPKQKRKYWEKNTYKKKRKGETVGVNAICVKSRFFLNRGNKKKKKKAVRVRTSENAWAACTTRSVASTQVRSILCGLKG